MPRGRSGKGCRPWARSRDGEAGNFLLVSGVLLVTGFVLVAAALVIAPGLERGTNEEQRTDLVLAVEDLIATIDRAVNDYAIGGELDTVRFAEFARAVEHAAHEHAARAGVFISISLTPRLDTIGSRCLGLDPDLSAHGVVVGWEEATHEHGVVGVLYDIHVSDGRRSLAFDHYVEVRPCTDDRFTTHMAGWYASAGRGLVRDDPLRDDPANTCGRLFNNHCDDALATKVMEERAGDAAFMKMNPTIKNESIAEQQWQPGWRLREADGNVAHHSSAAANWLGFHLKAPEGMEEGDIMESAKVEVRARLHQQSGSNPMPEDKKLYLRVFAQKPASLQNPGTPDMEFVVGPLSQTLEWFELAVPDGPGGGPGWTHAEIESSWWEFRAIGPHQSGWRWEIDHYRMEGGLWVDPWRMDVRLEWPDIPSVFTEHELVMKYRLEPATEDEAFDLWVRDRADPDGDWWHLHTLADSAGAVAEFRYDNDHPALPNRMEFRLTDSDSGDHRAHDQDTIEILLMRVTSRLPVDGA